ncbi:MAG: TlpA family protein disulfide reductase [Clostridiales bacterium]|nr:TlpA family protein disulfide reductase [Clostridiales bacterium]
MKKFFTLIICIFVFLSIVSCSADDKRDREREEETEVEETEVEETADTDSNFDPDFTFSTTDRDGNTYTEDIFRDYELTMINFWEPWCGPCVGEMPDLQILYNNYSNQGFNILGVYSETSMEQDVEELLSSAGIKYPILHYTDEFNRFQSGYVPTTIFVDGEGHVVSSQPYVGSMDYEDWASVVEDLLG